MTKTLVGTPDPDDDGAAEAVEVLKGLLETGSEGVRLSAAREILDRAGIKAGEYVVSAGAGTAATTAVGGAVSHQDWRLLNSLNGGEEPAAEPEETTRGSVLLEARGLITGDRNVSYGTPTQNFTNIAEMWTTRFRHKLADGERFTGADVGDFMILLKVARNIAQTKRDNAVDLAGYAACGWEAYLEENGLLE